ncbi:MarR family winged helix-turn-helix transcriptional regulator [Aurantimonas sp. VKM B-3413]|uniref:MarR family winged helix-turn-helix transcriptional regulator n=1 Tax=Aurantimonas sp. VKM B-3413 TaxID=2779401 RepID=UPI001E546E28|nr:MarR family transcriptional regulator [Aurantimonas sp. VKM B-3413]MCB8838989.1 MarR family transcriptional regulator [Aurantimonas sp. VKM B-3413]
MSRRTAEPVTESAKSPAGGRRADRGEKICLGELENYIAFHLRLAQNASFKAFKRQTGQSDLRPGRFAVLALIHHNPGITPMALSLASGRDKSTITPVLRDLQRAGLIIRTPVPKDKRSHSLDLTAAGEEMLAHLAACAAEHDRDLDRIVGDRKPELLDLLRRIVAAMN